MNTDISPTWPHGKKFALCLTHDVDRVKKTYQHFTYFLKTQRPYHLLSLFQKNEPYWNFEKIMEIENKYGVKSTFFFLNERGKASLFSPREWKLYLGRYDIYDSDVIDVIRNLHENGWEIGMHGSYNSYNNKDMLAKEKRELEELIGDEILGIRQHYLNLEIPKTWKIQEEVGFKYDTTFGFQDKIGFRSRKYYPFYPFDDSSFLEIPLAIMDVLLFKDAKNMEEAWKKCKELINITEKKGGILTVLWHQRVFNEKEFPGWSRIYEKIIKVCKEMDAWITTAKDIAEWWNDKCGGGNNG